jgi:hypothetical protein
MFARDKKPESSDLRRFCRAPSGGLEPPTPSLPWRFRGGNCVHARSLARTFVLQIAPSVRVASARAYPHVLSLMYPSRTRGTLSVLTTNNGLTVAQFYSPRSRAEGLFVAFVEGETHADTTDPRRGEHDQCRGGSERCDPMLNRPPLTDLMAELIAGRLRVLGQPLRVKLVDRLAIRETTVHFAGNSICPFAGLLCKPSDGLEPSTPSLPCAPLGNRSQPTATALVL